MRSAQYIALCLLIHSERAVVYQNNRMRNFLSNLFCVFVLRCNLGTRGGPVGVYCTMKETET